MNFSDRDKQDVFPGIYTDDFHITPQSSFFRVVREGKEIVAYGEDNVRYQLQAFPLGLPDSALPREGHIIASDLNRVNDQDLSFVTQKLRRQTDALERKLSFLEGNAPTPPLCASKREESVWDKPPTPEMLEQLREEGTRELRESRGWIQSQQ